MVCTNEMSLEKEPKIGYSLCVTAQLRADRSRKRADGPVKNAILGGTDFLVMNSALEILERLLLADGRRSVQ